MKILFTKFTLVASALFLTTSCMEDPMDGIDGTDGENGLNSLINVTEEPAGNNCSNGGFFIQVGLDQNQNGTLEDEEINTATYICNGVHGQDGTDGEDGVSADQIIVMTIEEPAGDNCIDGGVKIIIGYDNNDNDELETEEVTAISYVCDGEDAPEEEFEGKTYVIFSGEITDAQAKEKIANEIGSGTQFIWVQNTTQLDSLDIPNITELVELKVDNSSLKSIKLDSLETIYESFQINSDSISNLSFLNLTDVYGDFRINSNRLTEIEFLRLKNISNIMNIFAGNDQEVNIRFPEMESLDYLEIYGSNLNEILMSQLVKASAWIYSGNEIPLINFGSIKSGNIGINAYVTEIMLPEQLIAPELYLNFGYKTTFNNSIIEIGGLGISGDFQEISFPNLIKGDVSLRNFSSISLPVYEEGNASVESNSITTLDLLSYQKGYLSVSNNPNLTTINAPTLDSANVGIRSNDILQGIDLSSLVYIYSEVSISENYTLDNLSFPNLSTLGTDSGYLYFNTAYNNLNAASINNILVMLDNANLPDPENAYYFELYGNTAPTDEGITAKESLISKGYEVVTD